MAILELEVSWLDPGHLLAACLSILEQGKVLNGILCQPVRVGECNADFKAL